MASRNLIRMITPSSKVASALDWRKQSGGAVLSLDIHRNSIGLAIAPHPSIDESATTLDPIPLCKKGKVSLQHKKNLADILKTNNICGIVVSWPLQEGTGRMGAACGRVFHTLEDLMSESSSEIIAIMNHKPICLWDSEHAKNADAEDRWGRSVAYCRTSSKRIHKASEEQYNQDENIVASEVWDDFMHTHWPELAQHNSRNDDSDTDDDDDWKNNLVADT
jgi:RNase H-fold protein (predicted Holliday junction resolvase)